MVDVEKDLFILDKNNELELDAEKVMYYYNTKEKNLIADFIKKEIDEWIENTEEDIDYEFGVVKTEEDVVFDKIKEINSFTLIKEDNSLFFQDY